MTDVRPLLALACFVLCILFAVSPFVVPSFSGFDPNQFPVPQDDPPVQPAGYAFAIWGVIYLWLILGTGWGLWRARTDAAWHAMRKPLCVSLAVGAVWLSVAVASPIWASVLIWIMLLSALSALFLAPRTDILWAALPIGLYAGWLSAASCVSLGLLAAGYGFMDEVTAGLVFVTLAIVIGAFVQTALGNAPTYGAAVIWALIAVGIANINTTPIVASVAWGGAVVMLWPTFKALRGA